MCVVRYMYISNQVIFCTFQEGVPVVRTPVVPGYRTTSCNNNLMLLPSYTYMYITHASLSVSTFLESVYVYDVSTMTHVPVNK